jgi:hypothetical protein
VVAVAPEYLQAAVEEVRRECATSERAHVTDADADIAGDVEQG